MENKYTDELIERIERYENGELSAEEHQAFKRQMSEDEGFRQLVEGHRLLLEGIQMASYQEEREKLREIHQLVATEERQEDNSQSQPRFRKISYPNLPRMAAVFLIGIGLGLGTFYFLKPGMESDEHFGGTTNGLPVFEKEVPLILLTEGENQPNTPNRTLPVVLLSGSQENIQYEWEQGQLQLFFPKIPEISNWDQASIAVILEQLPALNLEIGLLKINETVYIIPLTNEDFFQLRALPADN